MADKNEIRVLVVDDSVDTLEIIKRHLQPAGYRVMLASDVPAALSILNHEVVDIVITDWKMPGIDGMELIRYISENYPNCQTMMLTGYATVQGAVEAVKTGAADYLAKPFTEKELLEHMAQLKIRVIERQNATRSVTRIDPHTIPGLIWASDAMEAVCQKILKVASVPATVMITGDSGTGKELVARAIHYNGNRSSAPFVAINCGAIPENLLESELFGYTKGAFTGADRARAGYFQTADTGTIFLDEINETSLAMQVKLLRVIQEREVFMVGSSKPTAIDVRILAATNSDLSVLVEKQRFREDLFFRLNVLNIHIPPLRERREDISLLVRHFLTKFSKDYGYAPPDIEDSAMQAMKNHDWSGNVRELENLIQSLVIMNGSDTIRIHDFPGSMRHQLATEHATGKTLAQVELDYIRQVLNAVGGNKTRAASILGIDRKTLREKLQHGQ